MIQDKEHYELNNLMTPIVNFLLMRKRFKDLDDKTRDTAYAILEENEEQCNKVMPRIREILKGEK